MATRKRSPKIGDYVRVFWTDAWEEANEETIRAMPDGMPMVTVGELVRQGPVVSVAAEKVVLTGGYRGTTHIPASIVTNIEVLEVA